MPFYGIVSAGLQRKMWRNAIMFNAYRWCDETQSENRRVFMHETTDQIKCLTCIQTLELRVCFPIANESESQDVFPRSGDETEFPIFVLNGTRTDFISNFFIKTLSTKVRCYIEITQRLPQLNVTPDGPIFGDGLLPVK